jgi:NADPH:quinone reductase-like Zn-dependent oxidoreductase
MKALIFRETGEPNGVLKMAEIPTPPLAPGEALGPSRVWAQGPQRERLIP